MSRLLLFAQWAALVVGLATLTNIGHAADPKPDPPPRMWLSSTYATEPGCLPSVKAITYYRRAYTSSRETMGATGAPARVWYQNCTTLRRRATMWRDRAHVAARELAAYQRYQYAWWEWMPRGWQNIGACETGYGRRPGNFRHNSGTYQGFAGFAVSSWDAFVRSADPKAGPYPSEAYLATPRQQYEVALAIWRRYGLSGWGCRGAF